MKRRLAAFIRSDQDGVLPPLVEAAVSGANDDRALAAIFALSTAAAASAVAHERLTPQLRLVLVRGVANRRTPDPTGQAGVLGVAHVVRAAHALVNMPPEILAGFQSLLARAGGGPTASLRADPDLEKALLLKAAAARRERLGPSRLDALAKERGQTHSTQAEHALSELEWFADAIRGAPREQVVRMTTLLDVESTRNTSAVDPLDLLAMDTRSDNDGLYQRYLSSCAPTAAQLVLGEGDPSFALALQREGNFAANNSAAARQQRAVLTTPRFTDARRASAPRPLSPKEAEAFRVSGELPPEVQVEGGSSTLRLAAQLRRQAETRAEHCALDADERRALASFLRGAPLPVGELQRAHSALATLRAAHQDTPSDGDVALMRGSPAVPEQGMSLLDALDEVVGRNMRTTYERRDVSELRSAREVSAIWSDVAARLMLGQSVPLRVGAPKGDGGHFMVLSDVRGRDSRRRYLVSDPYSGRTAWVPERALLHPKSGWIERTFEMDWTHVTDVYRERAP